MHFYVLAAFALLGPDAVDQVPQPRAQIAEPAQARANLASYVRANDYPAEALKKGEQGIVRFRLAVDERGRVTDCAIAATSGSPSLDEVSCRIMIGRARFRPAIDIDGKKVADRFDGSWRWTLFN